MKKELKKKEKWNENIETCFACGIEWKKIGKLCPICFAPAEKDYSKYCHEYLPDEVERLRKKGRTGVEAHIAANSYEKRIQFNLTKKNNSK